MKRLWVSAAATCFLASCGAGESAEAPSAELPASTLAEVEAPAPPAPPPVPEPLSAEQQAVTNAEINLTALKAYKDYAENFRADTGSYPATKRNFRSAVGAFEDAAEAELDDGTRVRLDLPVGAEMTKPGAIVYRSDGTDYKLIAQRTGDCSVVKQSNPDLIDQKREYGPGDCIAYGYWTSGAETW